MALSTRQQEHVQTWLGSGLTKSAYCREHGLNFKTFCRWCRLVSASETENAPPNLIPVTIQTEALLPEHITLRLSQGHILELPTPLSPQWLGALLQCLG